MKAVKKLTKLIALAILINMLMFIGLLGNIVSALSITSVNPDKGPVEGGQEVTIYGDFYNSRTNVVEVSASRTHTCVLGVDGIPYCWGRNSNGPVGDNAFTNRAVPVVVHRGGALAGKTITQISAGDGNSSVDGSEHTCALDSDGKAYCWGYNNVGQLGDNSTTTRFAPVAVNTTGVLAGKHLKQIDTGLGISTNGTGYAHVCALDTEGKAYCWGGNRGGELGDNSTTDRRVPVAVDMTGVLAGKELDQISTGAHQTCAIDTGGKAYCWGDNAYGGLGNGTSGPATGTAVPAAVDDSGVLNGKKLMQISVGLNYSCAVDIDGGLYCWGHNLSGQLGDNSTTTRVSPVAVNTSGVLAGKKITQVSAGFSHTCALDPEGSAYCWGSGFWGELGNNDSAFSSVPVTVYSSGAISNKPLVQVSAGVLYTCAYDINGRAYCWGQNSNREFGNNSTASSNVPVCVHTIGDGTGSALPGLSCGRELTVVMDPDGTPAECTNVVIASNGQSLTCTTSAHTAGIVDVTISDGTNEVTLVDGYEYIEEQEDCTGDCDEEDDNDISSHWKDGRNKYKKGDKTLTFIIDYECSLLDEVIIDNKVLVQDKDYTVSCIDDKLNITLTPEYLNTLDPDTNYPITVTFTDGEEVEDIFTVTDTSRITPPNTGILQIGGISILGLLIVLGLGVLVRKQIRVGGA